MEILGIALIVCIVVLAGIAFWLLRYFLVTLPSLQLNTLSMFSMMAVNQTKLRYPLFKDLEQKQQAIEKLHSICQEFGIIHPGYNAVEVAVDNAFYRYDQEKLKLNLEHVKGDIKKTALAEQTTSAILPVVLPKKITRTPKFIPSGEMHT